LGQLLDGAILCNLTQLTKIFLPRRFLEKHIESTVVNPNCLSLSRQVNCSS
jgi:hypothetical protein